MEEGIFKRFDVVSDDSDHHFHSKKISFSNPRSNVYKSIIREWKTLKLNLPESIYVRVYEGRIDLMRAVIIGAAGTPYHDGLFFFDVQFPYDYPNVPPNLHYHSFGLTLNPNLYANGKVCLSLLNTWVGKKSETWDPAGSTLLQVLLSLQALVLNEKPFYNEPGHRVFGRSAFENQSRAYNEHAFILTCYTSVYLIRRPPMNFEAFVRDHFRERGPSILMACNEYVNGHVRIGYYNCNEGASSSSLSTGKVSKAFKGYIERYYPMMVREFRRCGASLGTSIEQLEVQMELPERKNHGMFKKVMEKIKKVFGWNKSSSSSSSAEGREMQS